MMANLLDDLDPIFADCTGDEDAVYTLTKPWVHNGFVYATDGKIAVRQPTTQPDTAGYDKPSPPNPEQLFDDNKPPGEPITLPDIGPEPGDTSVCEKCNGRKPKKCNTCNGSGECECLHCRDEHECAECNGHGVLPWCSECDGTGTITRERKSVKLAPEHMTGLADYYVWFLQRHGVKAVHKALKGTAFCFRKGNIEGLVMGMALGADDDG